MLWLVLLLSIGALSSGSGHGLDFEYHDYEDMHQFLKNVTYKYPKLTYLYSIGKSVEGRELWVLEVSAVNITQVSMAPNVKIIGNIHGNEPVGKEMILHLIELLVSTYQNDSYITKILNTTRIHFLPSMNPDGGEIAPEGQCHTSPGRENNRSIDLNRNFPDMHAHTVTEQNNITEPETEAVKKWMEKYTFVLSASLHGGALVANYPFENRNEEDPTTRESKSPDDDVCKHLARTYANAHLQMHKGVQCESGEKFKGGITNGAAWYPVLGGMQDYNYLAHGIIEVTLEISCCKYPESSELKNYWEDNKMALLKYIDEAHQGIKGVVLDEVTRLPVKGVMLRIKGRNATFGSDEDGQFWRILLPGTYTIEVEADGYVPQSRKFKIQRDNDQPTSTILEIVLSKPSSAFGNDIGDDDSEPKDKHLSYPVDDAISDVLRNDTDTEESEDSDTSSVDIGVRFGAVSSHGSRLVNGMVLICSLLGLSSSSIGL